MKVSGIYKIQSEKKPKRIYIGSARDISFRWQTHLRSLRKNKHHSAKLQRHYNKYGESDLQFSILLGCDKEDLLVAEQYYLDSYKPYFNIYMVAGSPLGFKMPAHVVEKMRQAFMGENNPNYGKHLSEEHRRKLSEAKKGISVNKGRKHTEDAKRKISESKKGKKNPHKGNRPSEEAIEEIKRKLKGKIPWNKGKPNPHKGHSHTEEHKRKIGEAQIGRTHSDETKRKMSEARKKYYLLKRVELLTN